MSKDLMPEKVSRMFRVNFDLYTPRAHFIILPVEEFKESIKQYPELKKDTKLELLKSAKSIVSEYKLQNSAILSLHFGSWLSTKNKFHAHICVDVDDYLKIFSERRKEAIVFPPENKRNKWSNGKDTEDYEKNVRKYPPHTYFLEEVQAIHTIKGDRSKPTESGASNITCPPSPYLLHPSEPRVGYVVENSETPKDNESDLKALKEMCLVLDEKPHEVKAIHTIEGDRNKPTESGASNITRPPPPFLLHPSEPRVGYVVENSETPRDNESDLKALEEMFKYAEDQNLTEIDKKDDNNGCHVCLVLDGKSHGFSLKASQILVGFIQVSGLKFYKDFCPDDDKPKWFGKFKKLDDYKVLT